MCSKKGWVFLSGHSLSLNLRDSNKTTPFSSSFFMPSSPFYFIFSRSFRWKSSRKKNPNAMELISRAFPFPTIIIHEFRFFSVKYFACVGKNKKKVFLLDVPRVRVPKITLFLRWKKPFKSVRTLTLFFTKVRTVIDLVIVCTVELTDFPRKTRGKIPQLEFQFNSWAKLSSC